MEYEVIYKIQVDAESPVAAAIQVEKILTNPTFRPYFTVITPDKKQIDIDLENGDDLKWELLKS
jgi:hypothetical protein